MVLIKFLISLTILMLACRIVSAQSTCAIQEDETPAIRGFRLGMTVNEVKQRQPLLKDDSDETGYFSFKVDTIFLVDDQRRGLREMQLGFLDGRLVYIIVVYDHSTKWESVEQFAAAISKSLGVPPLWTEKVDAANPKMVALQVPLGKVTYAVAGRKGASLEAPLFTVFRNDTKPIRDARRAEIEAMKRRSFKP